MLCMQLILHLLDICLLSDTETIAGFSVFQIFHIMLWVSQTSSLSGPHPGSMLKELENHSHSCHKSASEDYPKKITHKENNSYMAFVHTVCAELLLTLAKCQQDLEWPAHQ